MIPISLTLSGFLSYQDPVEIDFTAFDLACIAGANGAGKSSILDAITWVLFGQARQRGDTIINNQSEQAEVIFSFHYEENRYQIKRNNPRGKAGMLEFNIAQQSANGESGVSVPSAPAWKSISERTIRETQQRIEETLRLDYETFVNAAFFLQGKADQFTQQRASDRKRILASILGLEVWETYRKRAGDQRKQIESQIAALDGRLSEIHAELSEETVRKKRLKDLESALKQIAEGRTLQEASLEQIKQLNQLLDERRKGRDALAQRLVAEKERRASLTEKLADRQKESESYAQILARAPEIEHDHQRWQQIRVDLARWDETAGEFREHEKRRQEPLSRIDAESARLSQELKTLQEQQVAISEQWSVASHQRSTRDALQLQITSLQSQIETRQFLEAELTTAHERLAAAKAENPRLKADMDELKARIDRLIAADESESCCPLCEQPLSPDERQRLIDDLAAQGTEMGDKHRSNRDLLKEADELVSNLQLQITNLQSVDEDLRTKARQYDQLAAQIEQAEVAQAAWEQEVQPRLDEITYNLQHETFNPSARAELAQIDAELKAIGYDAAAHDIARKTERELHSIEEERLTLEKAKAANEPIAREIAEIEVQLEHLAQSIAALEQDFTAAEQIVAEAEQSAPDLRQARLALLDLQEQENRLRMEVGAAQQNVQVLDDLRLRRKELEAERQSLAKRSGQYKQLETAFGKDGVPALLIEQALPQIETRANDILDRLSGGEMFIRFDTQRELKTREHLKETLDIRISDSAGLRDYELYSGGEAFRVNFAIRLALSEVLAQRAGARLQTLVIDEGFGSQDEVGRQRLLEAINLVKADFAKILVITHIDSLKDAFPARIEVEKTPHGSVVKVI
ncbi:MAG: SMC family ATPase [Chloroflexi bacterium]|jgi:DNA repair protein SbcC/Rad50|nr:SMC family ATPase [Chloroflexota bacterium]